MASFSTSFSLIALLYTFVFALPINSYPLDNICKQTKNPNFCFNLLKPHSNENLQQLEQTVIDATLSTVTTTSAKIQSLLPKTTDPNLIVIYSLCANYYGAAQSALTAAKEKLTSRQYGDLNTAADIVSEDASSCQKTFSMARSKPIPIASDNSNFDLLSNIFVVVSRVLSASG